MKDRCAGGEVSCCSYDKHQYTQSMTIDMRTLILTQTVAYVLCTIVMVLLWQQNRHRFGGLTCWLGDFALQTLAVALFVLRGVIPAALSIMVGNALIVIGLILFYNGLELFFERRSNPIRHGVLLVLFLAVHGYFTFVQPNLAARNINSAVAILVIYLQCTWLISRVGDELHPVTQWASATFIGFCLVSLMRIGVNLALTPQGDFLSQQSPLEAGSMIAYQALVFASVFIIFLMINRRLSLDTEKHQQALQVSETHYRQLVELSPEAIAVYAEERIIYVNSATVTLLHGVSPDDFLGKSVLEFVHPDFLPKAQQHIAEALNTGEPAPLTEQKLIRRDGAVVDVEVVTARLEYQGRPALQTIARDVTHRKRIEAQLQAYQQQLEAQNLELRKLSRAIEQSASTIVMTDLQGAIEFVNPAFTRITGFTAEEALGQNPRVLKSGLHPPEFYAEMWTTILRGETWQGELINRKKDGELYYEAATISPVKDNAGKIRHFIAIKDDITARKRAEEALRQSEEELRRYAEQLAIQNAELDAFAHTVAHDLKNPIGLIIGYAALLQDNENALSAAQRESALQIIAQTGNKLDIIIEELMLLSGLRKQTITPTPVDVLSVAQEAQQRLLDQIAQRGATLVIHTAAPWPMALGYGPWIEEVWANYISNALKYGGTPPHIEIGWDWVEKDEGGRREAEEAAQSEAPVSAFIPQPSSFIRFWVRDNGPGLNLEAQTHLFTPFTRLDQVRAQGHGLGLSIVQRIIEKLGGQVGVQSASGAGSTFYFELPAAPGMSSECIIPAPTRAAGPQPLTSPLPAPEGLPAEWLAQLRQAVIECDAHTIEALSAALTPEHATVAWFLEARAANFDYEAILNWLAATAAPA